MSEKIVIRDGSKTKAKILSEAKALFSLNGYKATTVRTIAAAVGIKQSALYNHFKNKEDIFKQIIENLFANMRLDESKVNELALGGKTFLKRFITEYKLSTFDKQSEALFRILMIELFQNASIREKFLNDYHEKNIKYLSAGFFTMMHNGLIRSGDPILLANEFLSPLFYLRLQVTLLRLDSISTTSISTNFEKHVEFFWESVSLSN